MDGEPKKRLRLIAASAFGNRGTTAYCAASLPDLWAARSRSRTVRQPLERLARLLIMQEVIAGILGISELHRRNASPVHIDCASALKAKPEVDETAEIEAAKTSAKPALRKVLVKVAVMFGSRWHRTTRARCSMTRPCAGSILRTVTDITLANGLFLLAIQDRVGEALRPCSH